MPKAFGDFVLVLPREEDSTIGGMLVAETNTRRASMGTVVGHGPGRYSEHGMRFPMDVSVGDLVSFPNYAGVEITDPLGFPAGTYFILRQDELFLNYGPQANHEETHE